MISKEQTIKMMCIDIDKINLDRLIRQANGQEQICSNHNENCYCLKMKVKPFKSAYCNLLRGEL